MGKTRFISGSLNRLPEGVLHRMFDSPSNAAVYYNLTRTGSGLGEQANENVRSWADDAVL